MGAGQEQSPWLELVRRFERAIGEPVEAFVRSDAYFDLMTQANRARARAGQARDEMSAEWLHLFNLPAASDVRRLREQLSRLEREVNRIAKALADLEESREAPSAARRASRPRRAASAGAKATRARGAAKNSGTEPADQTPKTGE